MPEALGPWPSLLGAAGAFLWLVRLIIAYQTQIGDRYSREIRRLDGELRAARDENAKLRGRIETLEDNQSELRFLRREAGHHGIFNPWEPPGLEGIGHE
jgi:hypothetical protein